MISDRIAGRRSLRWIAGALMIVLLACGCQHQGTAGLLPEASVVLPTATALPTSPPTVTQTASPMPTATATPLPTSTPTATPEPLRLQVRQSASLVSQGSTLAVYVTANRRCQIEGALGQRMIAFAPLDDVRSVAFVGVHAMAEEHDVMLSISATTTDGQRVELETPIQIVAGDYAHEALTFSPEISKLLDPSVTRPEMERLAEVYGQHTGAIAWQGSFQWPFEGPITSPFGTRRQYGDAFASYHAGIDIDGVTGDAVAACAAGTVVLAEALQVRGNVVIIDHGAGVMSGYYHLSQIDVEVGQQIAQGEVIGLMGETGLVTGSHLHWELNVGGVPVSPSEWLDVVWIVQG